MNNIISLDFVALCGITVALTKVLQEGVCERLKHQLDKYHIFL